jgi:hypothetical protein
MSSFSYDDMMRQIQDLLAEQPKRPKGVLLSRYGRLSLAAQLPPPIYDDRVTIANTVLGLPVFDLPDVPREEGVIFYDEKVMYEFLDLARAIGYKAALARCRPHVGGELLRTATLRSILEVT